MGERMKLNLDEITKALGELSEGRNQLSFYSKAPEWLRLLEELQRRGEKMQAVVDAARELAFYGPNTYGQTEVVGPVGELSDALAALDAKEQDDAASD